MAVGQNIDLKITFWDLMGNNNLFLVCSNFYFHLWSTALYPSLPHPEIIGICKNIHSYTSGCFFAYCIPSPCMQKDNYHSTSSSLSMQSRLIMPPVLIPFTPFMSQNNSEWRARHIVGYEGRKTSREHAEKLEPKSEQFR